MYTSKVVQNELLEQMASLIKAGVSSAVKKGRTVGDNGR